MTQDATNARQRLLDAALEVFATKGYASASTREICRLASANVSAIHYYFGDKASLYQQLFERLDQFLELPSALTDQNVPLDQALLALYRHLLEFSVPPARSQRFRALFVREQLQPSGILSEAQKQGLAPFYKALLEALQHDFATTADSDLHRLALALMGLPSMLMLERDLVDAFAPEITENKEQTARLLTDQALVLVQYERDRRSNYQKVAP
ncbi:MAG TPA: CerR family C-terminal domain-containing protein [Pseudomonadales bacterium]|nr:CerR family C-terminal domain-containing protein [Pseudomonadales bacterium]